MKKIFVLTGEPSGDKLASKVIAHIKKSKFDIARKGQDKRIPCFPVNTIEDLLTDKHLSEREFFIELEHPYVGKLKYPGVAYKLSNPPKDKYQFHAPVLGQDNDIISKLIGE